MKSTYKSYDSKESLERLDEILKVQDNQFEEFDYIPDLSKITYSNGYYINCGVICCDIRESTKLYKDHKRPVIARIMRSFISEVVAVMTDSSQCKEIFIEGDCVWAVFNTPDKKDIDSMFDTSAQINSVMKFVNYKLSGKSYPTIKAGIGLSYGRVLVIKAGYNGSGINELVWIGPAVGEAHELAGYGNKNSKAAIFVSNVVYNNLNETNSKFCSKSIIPDAYGVNVVNTKMNNYYDQHCN